MATLPIALLGGVFSGLGGLIGAGGAKSAGTTIGRTGTDVGQSINTATGGGIGAGYQGLADATTSLGQGWEQVGNTNSLQSSLYGNNSGLLSQIYNNTGSTLQPYLAAGNQGVAGMQSLLNNYQPFSYNPQDVSKDPAYQFELGQGTQALESQAAAAGMLQSGSNEKGIENYAQGLASTFENQDYQQALGTYQTNFSNQMQGLNTLAGYGQNANAQNVQLGLGYGSENNQLALGYGNQAGQTAGLSTSLAQSGANTNMQGEQYIGSLGLQGAVDAGNFYMAGAQGTAAGQMGSANAWSSALNGIGGALGMGLGGGSTGGYSGGGVGGTYMGNGVYQGGNLNPISIPGYGPVPVTGG